MKGASKIRKAANGAKRVVKKASSTAKKIGKKR